MKALPYELTAPLCLCGLSRWQPSGSLQSSRPARKVEDDSDERISVLSAASHEHRDVANRRAEHHQLQMAQISACSADAARKWECLSHEVEMLRADIISARASSVALVEQRDELKRRLDQLGTNEAQHYVELGHTMKQLETATTEQHNAVAKRLNDVEATAEQQWRALEQRVRHLEASQRSQDDVTDLGLESLKKGLNEATEQINAFADTLSASGLDVEALQTLVYSQRVTMATLEEQQELRFRSQHHEIECVQHRLTELQAATTAFAQNRQSASPKIAGMQQRLEALEQGAAAARDAEPQLSRDARDVQQRLATIEERTNLSSQDQQGQPQEREAHEVIWERLRTVEEANRLVASQQEDISALQAQCQKLQSLADSFATESMAHESAIRDLHLNLTNQQQRFHDQVQSRAEKDSTETLMTRLWQELRDTRARYVVVEDRMDALVEHERLINCLKDQCQQLAHDARSSTRRALDGATAISALRDTRDELYQSVISMAPRISSIECQTEGLGKSLNALTSDVVVLRNAYLTAACPMPQPSWRTRSTSYTMPPQPFGMNSDPMDGLEFSGTIRGIVSEARSARPSSAGISKPAEDVRNAAAPAETEQQLLASGQRGERAAREAISTQSLHVSKKSATSSRFRAGLCEKPNTPTMSAASGGPNRPHLTNSSLEAFGDEHLEEIGRVGDEDQPVFEHTADSGTPVVLGERQRQHGPACSQSLAWGTKGSQSLCQKRRRSGSPSRSAQEPIQKHSRTQKADSPRRAQSPKTPTHEYGQKTGLVEPDVRREDPASSRRATAQQRYVSSSSALPAQLTQSSSRSRSFREPSRVQSPAAEWLRPDEDGNVNSFFAADDDDDGEDGDDGSSGLDRPHGLPTPAATGLKCKEPYRHSRPQLPASPSLSRSAPSYVSRQGGRSRHWQPAASPQIVGEAIGNVTQLCDSVCDSGRECSDFLLVTGPEDVALATELLLPAAQEQSRSRRGLRAGRPSNETGWNGHLEPLFLGRYRYGWKPTPSLSLRAR